MGKQGRKKAVDATMNHGQHHAHDPRHDPNIAQNPAKVSDPATSAGCTVSGGSAVW